MGRCRCLFVLLLTFLVAAPGWSGGGQVITASRPEITETRSGYCVTYTFDPDLAPLTMIKTTGSYTITRREGGEVVSKDDVGEEVSYVPYDPRHHTAETPTRFSQYWDERRVRPSGPLARIRSHLNCG